MRSEFMKDINVRLLKSTKYSTNLALSGRYFDTISYAIARLNDHNICITDHLYPLYSFLNDLNEHYEFIETNLHSLDPKQTKLILFDLPSIHQLKSLLKYPFQEIILLEAECPLFSHRKLIDNNWTIISPYNLKYRSIKTDTAFIYKYIDSMPPTNVHSTFAEGSICIVNSNIKKPPPFTYYFRRHLINVMSVAAQENFYFYGKGWSSHKSANFSYQKALKFNHTNKILLDLYSSTISLRESLKTKLPEVDLYCYKGRLANKSDLNNIDFSLAIENILTINNYTTEKTLEPLTYNSYPLAVTQKESYLSRYLEILPLNVFDIMASYRRLMNQPSFSLRNTVSEIRSNINQDLMNEKIKTNLKSLLDLLLT